MPLSITRDRLVALLAATRGRRIVVVGDAMLDVYLRGDVDRISPEAPVPVVRVRERKHALGGAANVAQNVVATGAHCDLVAAVGADRGAEVLRSMLSAIQAAPDTLVEVDRPTTTKTRIVARSQQVVRVDEEDDADLAPDEIDRLLDAVRRSVREADALVLEDYNKGVLVPRVITEAIEEARARGIPIIVDPKYRN
ncbi:MAG TPA: PfkB family carbohydrate kinase, partial [Gemmatimonadaceae bacterium]|nr:PfkB family carbohydrate kinase [Gemmatimonadaceae bacterium]